MRLKTWLRFMLVLVAWPVSAETLLFTSNTPELYPQDNGYSLAKMANYVARLKQQDEAVKLLHGGDSLSPNPLSVYDHGAHLVAIFNEMSVDVLALNRREFNYGIDQVTLLSGQSAFPMVLSNLRDKRTNKPVAGVLTHLLMPLGRYRIGILSAVSDSINSTYLFDQARVKQSAEHLNGLAAGLKSQGADFTVLVTEADYLEQVPLAKLKGIDVVLITYEGPDTIVSQQPLVIRSGGIDDEMVALDFSDQQVSGSIVKTADEPPLRSLEAVIARYTSQLNVVLEQPITTLSAPMDSYRTTLRSGESSWANLVLDAVRDYGHADFAALGGGSFRGDRSYPAGYQLTRRDIQKELPFGGRIHVVDITLSQLKQMLEHGVSKVAALDGRFLQVSGLIYHYDSSRPVGQRIVTLTDAKGHPLDDRVYRLAVSDYMLRGGDDYQFDQAQAYLNEASQQRLIWNIVSDYLANRPSVTPAIEGRIIPVSPASHLVPSNL
ncbi:bifunctional metallophosphatase/5'-nucleotidase [Marinomonas ostreistagni]|uniref:bifunctional metallophosphatase/5'-nucleotidase n=1 Tax=Marinomonas ostreistagni TaxID=359209 RepID=UPI0019508988|nr:5'-nucleotidase C-terminal domain-containing protein [Marinomonas ostreistagni]MBM6552016.1 bifunctional metallophosphatase/5'-nucleotidase [Marinomonas ostreistagni]